MSTALVGNAGAYYVAAKLSGMGLVCAPTFRNTPNVDLLVSDKKGSAFVSVQVKTSTSALRFRGRGEKKKPDHYEWDVNRNAYNLQIPNLFFALVDLKGKKLDALPDVFIVPSKILSAYYQHIVSTYYKDDPKKWKRTMYQETVEKLEPYKNAWGTITRKLGIT